MATNDDGVQPRAAPRARPSAVEPARPPRPRPPARASAPQLAYVLHSYDWSESSLIVELFSRGQGRVVVVARGAKKPTSNFRAVLLPFVPLHALLGKAAADADAEILPLRSAEWVGGTALLGAAALLSAFYLNELLLKLLARQDPHPVLFDAYADTLGALAAEAGDGAVLRAFELLLLRELGWLPELGIATLTAEALQPQARYTLDAEAGLGANAHGVAGAAWQAIEAALGEPGAGAKMAALRAACAPVAAGLRAPLRQLLHYHLGDTKLRTRQVWQGVQRLADTR